MKKIHQVQALLTSPRTIDQHRQGADWLLQSADEIEPMISIVDLSVCNSFSTWQSLRWSKMNKWLLHIYGLEVSQIDIFRWENKSWRRICKAATDSRRKRHVLHHKRESVRNISSHVRLRRLFPLSLVHSVHHHCVVGLHLVWKLWGTKQSKVHACMMMFLIMQACTIKYILDLSYSYWVTAQRLSRYSNRILIKI